MGHYSFCKVPVREHVSDLPETFGLKGFPGRIFTIVIQTSYINDKGQVVLYLAVQDGQRWVSHSKATLDELRRQIVKLEKTR